MSLGKVYNVDIVADAAAVGSVVVIAKHGEFFTNACGGLSEIGHKVLRHTEGKLSDKCRRM